MVLFFPISALQGQTRADVRVFPLALLLEAAALAQNTAATSRAIWRPDWPFELPPDAFRLLSGEVFAITLEGEGFLLNFRQNAEGMVQEFPFMLGGSMVQVSLNFREAELSGLSLGFPPGQDLWELEFLEHEFDHPSLVRAFFGATWYFITFSRWERGITETWFDVEGNFLGAYLYSLAELGEAQRIRSIRDLHSPDSDTGTAFYYDSWGLLTGISGPGGLYTVLHYRDALPRYWGRPSAQGDSGGLFYLQWDANGFFVRMLREAPETGANAGGWLAERRFEYTLDARGNWIERREILMVYHAGFLFPAPGTTFRRILEYR